ncbi:hypothetical protein BQ8420_22480 [Nocardiopsis sp. JB363]|nr:hypothetical protein BQ8420_22480 [Nocardiopsis sp. JB363]
MHPIHPYLTLRVRRGVTMELAVSAAQWVRESDNGRFLGSPT